MANNFHDNGGWLIVGIDVHDALLLPGVPIPFVPTPMPRMPHLVCAHPFVLGGNQKSTVQFNGRDTVVHWHTSPHLWPHLNLPPFPIDILIVLHLAFGSHIAWLPRSTVLIEGEMSTCTAIAGPVSINLDCWDPINVPSSLVIQPGTVQTSPTLADYLRGFVTWAIDAVINYLVGKALEFVAGAVFRMVRSTRNQLQTFLRNVTDDASDAVSRSTANTVESAFNVGSRELSEDIRNLAASEGTSPLQRSARLDVIMDWMARNDMLEQFDSVANGFDLNHPLSVVEFPPPGTLDQYVRISDPLSEYFGAPGNWFDPLGGQSGDALGLNTAWNYRFGRTFDLPEGSFSALQSTAAPVVDNWTSGADVFTSGGGTQWLVPDAVRDAIRTSNPVPNPQEIFTAVVGGGAKPGVMGNLPATNATNAILGDPAADDPSP